eukprot:1314627-Amphidinium_carterae.2
MMRNLGRSIHPNQDYENRTCDDADADNEEDDDDDDDDDDNDNDDDDDDEDDMLRFHSDSYNTYILRLMFRVCCGLRCIDSEF